MKQTRIHDKGYTTIDNVPGQKVPVTEGKLRLVNVYETDIIDTKYIFGTTDKNKLCIPTVENHLSLLKSGLVAYKPIIISETEKIEVGDWVYNSKSGGVYRADDNTLYALKTEQFIYKILALPENFSPKHLQAIVDGKMKDGDKVLVECERVFYPSQGHGTEAINYNKIKLNSEQYITLHKVEVKMYTEEQVMSIMGFIRNGYNVNHDGRTNRFFLEKWFEQNIK